MWSSLLPCWWRQRNPPTRYLLTRLNGITSRKTYFLHTQSNNFTPHTTSEMAYPSSWSDGIRTRFDSQHRRFSLRHGIPAGSWARSAFNPVTTPTNNNSSWSAAVRTEIHSVRAFHPVERIAGDWSASDRAARAFTRATVCVKSPVDSVIVDFLLLSIQDRQISGWQQNHALCVSLQTRGILHGDSKHTHAKCHKEFVNWVVLSPNCNLNNHQMWLIKMVWFPECYC